MFPQEEQGFLSLYLSAFFKKGKQCFYNAYLFVHELGTSFSSVHSAFNFLKLLILYVVVCCILS